MKRVKKSFILIILLLIFFSSSCQSNSYKKIAEERYNNIITILEGSKKNINFITFYKYEMCQNNEELYEFDSESYDYLFSDESAFYYKEKNWHKEEPDEYTIYYREYDEILIEKEFKKISPKSPYQGLMMLSTDTFYSYKIVPHYESWIAEIGGKVEYYKYYWYEFDIVTNELIDFVFYNIDTTEFDMDYYYKNKFSRTENGVYRNIESILKQNENDLFELVGIIGRNDENKSYISCYEYTVCERNSRNNRDKKTFTINILLLTDNTGKSFYIGQIDDFNKAGYDYDMIERIIPLGYN